MKTGKMTDRRTIFKCTGIYLKLYFSNIVPCYTGYVFFFRESLTYGGLWMNDDYWNLISVKVMTFYDNARIYVSNIYQ